MPTGEITVRYVKADGTPAKDNGYFIARLDEEGRERGSRVHRSETRRAFLPGRYRISARGTETKDIREIDLQEGEKIEIEFVGD